MNVELSDTTVAEWGKTVIKWVGTGACDGLAAWASAYVFLGNPAAVGFFTAVASLAEHVTFEERGW